MFNQQDKLTEILQSDSTDRKLPLGKLLPLGFQHTVIAILAAIPVPLIISASAGLDAEQTRFFVSAVIFAVAW